MVNITLAVSDELKNKMDEFTDMNWSGVARAAIEKKVELLKAFKEFTRDSTMTEEDAIDLGRKVNASAAKRYKEEQTNKKEIITILNKLVKESELSEKDAERLRRTVEGERSRKIKLAA